MILGCLFGLSSSIWILVGGLKITHWQVIGVATFFGIGGTAMLISSLSLTADLIGDNTVSNRIDESSIKMLLTLGERCICVWNNEFL